MGLNSALSSFFGKGLEKKIKEVTAEHLQPGEAIEAWFVALRPGEVAQRARAAAAAGGGAALAGGGGALVGLIKRAGIRAAPDAEGIPFRGALVMTDRRIIECDLGLTGKPKAAKTDFAFEEFAAVEPLDTTYRVGIAKVGFGAVAMANGRVLVFEVAPPSAAAFGEFCARFKTRMATA